MLRIPAGALLLLSFALTGTAHAAGEATALMRFIESAPGATQLDSLLTSASQAKLESVVQALQGPGFHEAEARKAIFSRELGQLESLLKAGLEHGYEARVNAAIAKLGVTRAEIAKASVLD